MKLGRTGLNTETSSVFKRCNVGALTRLHNIIQRHKLLLESDKNTLKMLRKLEHYVSNAYTGDENLVKEMICEGSKILKKTLSILKHDAIEEQVTDDESAAIVEDKNRKSTRYFELRKDLVDFDNECFQKILTTEM